MLKLKKLSDVLDSFVFEESKALETYYDINYNISKFLVEYRHENGMTQHDLAKALGVSQVMISKYENGDYNFTLKKLCKISELLDVDVSFDFEANSDNTDTWNIDNGNLEDNGQWKIA